MFLPTTAVVIHAEHWQQERLEEAAHWRLASAAESVEHRGWGRFDVKARTPTSLSLRLAGSLASPAERGPLPRGRGSQPWQA